MTLVKNSEKEQLKKRLLGEIPELKKAGWKKIPQNMPCNMQYSKEFIDKLNTEYESESWEDWYDDWKYR